MERRMGHVLKCVNVLKNNPPNAGIDLYKGADPVIFFSLSFYVLLHNSP